MAALASPDWGVGAAQLDWPLLLPANARFDVATMANPEMGEIVAGIQDADPVRQLPLRRLRLHAHRDRSGAFLAGMVRLFREGSLENLDELSLDIAGDIEAAWLELEAAPTDRSTRRANRSRHAHDLVPMARSGGRSGGAPRGGRACPCHRSPRSVPSCITSLSHRSWSTGHSNDTPQTRGCDR